MTPAQLRALKAMRHYTVTTGLGNMTYRKLFDLGLCTRAEVYGERGRQAYHYKINEAGLAALKGEG